MQQSQKTLQGMIGLEIHVYPVTKDKLFCTCVSSRERGLKQNINICPICTAQPGAKPMLPNKTALEKAVQIGLMLKCKINTRQIWQRKHYNWPDLPKGYQNTLSGSGSVPTGSNGNFNGIRIRSMHLEEDPASWNPDTGEVDYNRSGIPLVEIITEPDFSTSEEAVSWLGKLLHNLEYLKAVDSNAGIKVDVNVSIPNKTERVEIKNINSIDNIGKAINYELERQLREGGTARETRRYDDSKGKTTVMRTKEGADDYRFIADPDLADIVLDKKFIDEIEKSLPESPDVKLSRLIKKYKIDAVNAEVLHKNIDLVEFFEKVAEKITPNFALPWVTIELLRFLNYNKITLDKADIKVEHFIALISLVQNGKLTPLKGKEILKQFYPKSFIPIVSSTQGKISDKKELEKVIDKVISSNKEAVNSFKNGEAKSMDFLMGAVMKLTEKRADYKIARELLEKALSK